MKLVPLSKGLFAMVDDEDFELVNQFKWSAAIFRNGVTYAVRSGKRNKGQKRGGMRMHRLILGLTDPKIFADHRDHNGLNNQRNNIRVATNSQNQANSIIKKDNTTSKHRGVRWRDNHSVWQAQIYVDNKQIHLGTFKTEIDAAIAYNNAALKHKGEFAILNQVQ
jgi:hypothetical protein